MLLASPRTPFLAGLMLSAALLMSAPASAQTIGELLKQPAPQDDPVIARAGTADIRRSDLMRSLDGLPPQVQQMPMQTVYPLILDRLVDGKLIAGAARAQKLNDDPEVKRKLADYEDRIVQEIYLNRAVAVKVDDKALEARYQQFLKDNPQQEEVRARHILVASEAVAKEIIADLKKGGDFATLAKAKSTDGSAKEGGDLGFFTREDMVPEFSEAAFGLKPTEFTQEPVKSQFGWHVIKLEQRRQTAAPALADMRDQLTSEMSQEMITKIVEDLRKTAKIEKFDIDGKPLPAAQ
jgi:peptidyl-prolyl cis-trans isomerase C